MLSLLTSKKQVFLKVYNGKDNTYRDLINEINSKILLEGDLHLLKDYLIRLLEHLDKIESSKYEPTFD
jgi:hypothetical protein